MSGSKANALVHALYGKVVGDVIAKSREEFLGEGLDASVLQELQTRWERKLAQCGAAPMPAAPVAAAPQASASSAAAVAPAAAGARVEPLALLGRPLAFLPAAGWITDTPASETLAPAPPEAQPVPQAADASRKRKEPPAAAAARAAPPPPSSQALVPAPPPAAGAAAGTGRDDDDSDDEEKDPDTKNLVLSQFEKVTHAKNKWKCVLRSGQMTLNGKDYVFNTAAGDFQW